MKEKLKVIHIVTLLELGGAQQNTLFTVTHLDRKKFDVGLICGSGAILDAEAKKIPNLALYFVPTLVRPIHPVKDLICLFQLIRILKKEKPDIVHTHSSKAGILGRIAARIAGVPIIIHSIHGFGFNPYQKIFVRWLFVFLERWTSKFSQTLIAVSKENIREGLELNIGKESQYVLIRSGIDIKKIKQTAEASDPARLKKTFGIPGNVKVVLTIGPFKIQKDPLSFVRLAGKVSASFPEAQFFMAGDGELREEIENLIRSLRLENHVRLLGWQRNVPELLRICDLFVMTSLWEGLPRAGVEALIVGKPVIAFAVNGLKEIVKDGENGFLFPPGEIDAMSQKVVQVLKEPILREQLSKNAVRSIDDSFDIHKMVHQQEDLYETLSASIKS